MTSPDDSLAAELNLYRTALALRIDRLEEGLQANTDATERVDRNTTELVGILNSWKGAMKVLDFLGKLAKPLAAIAALFGAWFTWRAQK